MGVREVTEDPEFVKYGLIISVVIRNLGDLSSVGSFVIKIF